MIGLIEREVKVRGLDYKVFKVFIVVIGKVVVDGEKEGFVKLIVDKKYLEVFGVYIYVYNVIELIFEYVVVMIFEVIVYEIVYVVYLYLIFFELIKEVVYGVIDKVIYI